MSTRGSICTVKGTWGNNMGGYRPMGNYRNSLNKTQKHFIFASGNGVTGPTLPPQSTTASPTSSMSTPLSSVSSPQTATGSLSSSVPTTSNPITSTSSSSTTVTTTNTPNVPSTSTTSGTTTGSSYIPCQSWISYSIDDSSILANNDFKVQIKINLDS